MSTHGRPPDRQRYDGSTRTKAPCPEQSIHPVVPDTVRKIEVLKTEMSRKI